MWSFETEAVNPRALVPWLFAMEYWKTTTAKPLPTLTPDEFTTLVNFVVFNRSGAVPESGDEGEGELEAEEDTEPQEHGFGRNFSRAKLQQAAEAAADAKRAKRIRLPAVRRYVNLMYNPLFT